MKIFNTMTKKKRRIYTFGRRKGKDVCMRAYRI